MLLGSGVGVAFGCVWVSCFWFVFLMLVGFGPPCHCRLLRWCAFFLSFGFVFGISFLVFGLDFVFFCRFSYFFFMLFWSVGLGSLFNLGSCV